MESGRGTVVLHIGGRLNLSGRVRYLGGRIVQFEDVDVDKLGFFTIKNFARNSGYEPTRMWFVKPGFTLTKGLIEIHTDAQVSEMVALLLEARYIDVYVDGEERAESDPEEEEVEEVEEDESVENVGNEEGGEVDMEVEVESEYANSEEELDGGSDDEHRRRLTMYKPDCDHKGLKFNVGLSFDSLEQFKEAIQDYAILNGVNVHWVRADCKRMEAGCVDGCPWRVYAGWLQRDRTVVVKTCYLEYKCTRALRNRQVTVK